MRIAIVGSRDYPCPDDIRDFVNCLPTGTEIVSGGARGVDRWAEEAARDIGLPIKIFPADWSKGKGAGFARNQTIVDYADEVYAFWDGQSSGTRDTIRRARGAEKPVEIIYPRR